MKAISAQFAAVLVVAATLATLAVFAQESSAGSPLPGEAMEPGRETTNRFVNLRDAPLELVLEHLANAAGCKLVLEAKVTGSAVAFSGQPLTRVEAYNLLNTLLITHGLAGIPDGDTLTVLTRDEAKTRGIPVRFGNDPQVIPRTDELVTQVIPIQFTEAAALLKNLQPLLPRDSIITANESANTIVMTDVQTSVRRAVEIIRAIDLGTEEVISVKVFRLKNADPVELAELLTELYPKPTQAGNAQSQSMMVFGMGPGQGGRGGMGGPGGTGGAAFGNNAGQSQSAGSQRLQKGSTVTVASDQRTASIIVSAPKFLMTQIAAVVQQLDADTARKQKVVVYQLKNASAYQVLNNLQDLFQKNSSTSTRTGTTQTDPLETRSSTQAQTQSTISSGVGSNSGGGSSQRAGGQ